MREIYNKLSKCLVLKTSGIEQDWAIEMADPDRVLEFVQFFKYNLLTPDEKYVLIELIIASYDEHLKYCIDTNDHIGISVRDILNENKTLIADLIEYWSCPNEADPDCIFRVSEKMRRLCS